MYQRFLTSLCLLFMKTVTYFPFDTKLLLVSSTYIRIYTWSDKSKRCCFRGVYVVHSPWYQNWLHCIIQYFVTSLTKTIFFRYTMSQSQYEKIAENQHLHLWHTIGCQCDVLCLKNTIWNAWILYNRQIYLRYIT